MEKQKITVRVAEKNYTLVSADAPEYLKRVAALVDRRLKEMELASGMPAQQVMALTCFNLADELLKAKDENTELKRRMQEGLAAVKADALTNAPTAESRSDVNADAPAEGSLTAAKTDASTMENGGTVRRRRSGNEA